MLLSKGGLLNRYRDLLSGGCYFGAEMTDFHTHILWDMDDGSRSAAESMRLVGMEKEQHVNRVVLTPHFYANRDGRDYFDRRNERCEKLMEALSADDRIVGSFSGIKFLLGAEVCYFSGIGTSAVARDLCIGNSDWMLLEMPFAQWNRDVLSDVIALIERQKICLIIAHVERYYPFQKNRDIWNEVLSLPVVPQINAGAFLHKWIVRRRVVRWIKKGMNVVIGSDCHNASSRPVNIAEARRVMADHLGEAAVRTVEMRADRLFDEMRSDGHLVQVGNAG